jgi:alanine dehydrogenase
MIRLDFETVHKYAKVKDLIEPLRIAFLKNVTVPPRSHYNVGKLGSGTLLVMPSWREDGPIGVKIATVFQENRIRGLPTIFGQFMLLSGATGEPIAWIDGRALTLLRTAAVSALAADVLAPPSASNLLMVGTGALASYLIEGHLAVRRYQSIAIWGRSTEKAAQLAQRVGTLGPPIQIVADLQGAVRNADVISCATMSDRALVQGQWLKPVSHLDLVGSFTPTMREADDECFPGAYVAVDTLNAVEESGDLIAPLANRTLLHEHIVPLQAILNGSSWKSTSRSIFKSVGCALEDLSCAEWIHNRAEVSVPSRPEEFAASVTGNLRTPIEQ